MLANNQNLQYCPKLKIFLICFISFIFVCFVMLAVMNKAANAATENTINFNEGPASNDVSDSGILEKSGFIYNNNVKAFQERDYNEIGLTAFRKSFSPDATKTIESATLFSTGLGVYEAYINGNLVHVCNSKDGKQECVLQPGWTQWNYTRMYTEYDVTDFMYDGENVISAIVSPSWWSDAIANTNRDNRPTVKDCINAKLLIKYSDGTTSTVATDNTWKTNEKKGSASKVLFATIYEGEKYDAQVSNEWMYPGYTETADWIDAVVEDEIIKPDSIFKEMQIIPWFGNQITVRKDLERSVKNIVIYNGSSGEQADVKYGKINKQKEYSAMPNEGITIKKGETALIDFGQNGAGWENFTAKGVKGSTLTIKHSEALNDNDGLISRGNDGPEGSAYYTNLMNPTVGITEYTLSGEPSGESYHPSFTFYGFRYIEMTCTEEITITKLAADTVTSVERENGNITVGSSKDPQKAAKVNQLISNTKWSMYSNYLSILSDCPQRNERKGWLGDSQVFCETAMYLCNAKGMLEKHCRDIFDVQHDNENDFTEHASKERWSLPRFAPTSLYDYRSTGRGIAGWADAGVIIPYELYVMYGDSSTLEKYWDGIYNYVMVYLPQLETETHKGGKNTYSDWLMPIDDKEPWKSYDKYEVCDFISCCYYLWDLKILSESCDILNKNVAKEEISNKYNEIYEWFLNQYFNSDRTYIDKTINGEDGNLYNINMFQSVLAYPLFLDLCPNEQCKQNTINQLTEDIKKFNGKLNTGFLGTRILLDTLSKCGCYDVAYNLLLQEDYPSWLYSINNGATTIWESWDSYTIESGFKTEHNSHNHYSYGCVVSWMFHNLLGINPNSKDAGFSNINLKPYPSEVLNKANGYYCINQDVNVKLNINSELTDNDWQYSIDIPIDHRATVTLPKLNFNTRKINEIDLSDSTSVKENLGINVISDNDKEIVFDIPHSGNYNVISFNPNNIGTESSDNSPVFEAAKTYDSNIIIVFIVCSVASLVLFVFIRFSRIINDVNSSK